MTTYVTTKPTALTGDVTSVGNATTINKIAITGKALVSAAVGDSILISDLSDSDNLKKVTVQTIVDLVSSGNVATDAIWDVAGDIVIGTGANTAARLALGAALSVLGVNAGGTTVEWRTLAEQKAALEIKFSGSGYLHHFYDRQYNYATNTGTNRRPSICYVGDSLAFRVAGFVSQWTKEDHPGKHGLGFASKYAISSFIPPGGPVVTLSGSATAVQGSYTLWINGCYWNLGVAGAIRWEANPTGPIECELLRVAYIAESGAGTFQIQTSTDSVTWTNRGGVIDANNASQIGVVVSVTISRQTVYVRVLGVTGTVKIIGPAIGFPATTKGCDFYDMSIGGIPPREAVRTPSAIYTPILTAIDPALFIVHFNDYEPAVDPIDGYSLYWDALIAVLRAGNANRSLLFVANGPQTDATKDAAVAATRNYLFSKIDVDRIAVIDMYAMTGPYSVLDNLNWEGDTVHAAPVAYAYGAEQVYRQFIRSRFVESNRPITIGGEAKGTSAINVIGGSIAVWGTDNVTEVHYYAGGSTFNDPYYSLLAPSYSAVSNGAGSIASLGMYVFDTGLGTRVRKVWINAAATYFMQRNGVDVGLSLFDGSSVFSGLVTATGSITGSNLSGTNTGDKTLSELLPTMVGQSGKYLTNNGTVESWGTVVAPTWGAITGTLSSQTDLQSALNLKAPLASPTFTGTVTAVAVAATGAVTISSGSVAPLTVSEGSVGGAAITCNGTSDLIALVRAGFISVGLGTANGDSFRVSNLGTIADLLRIHGTTKAATFYGIAILGIYTVATLPSASTNSYAEANVSDALAPVMGSTVVTGGAVKTKVRSNGTNWTVAGI